MTNRLVIIPARKNSKRIENKNMASVQGKPIIHYPLKIAIESKLFSKILVSTNDLNIIKYAQTFATVTTNLRPEALSDDQSTIYSVLHYEVMRLKEEQQNFTEIWLISATACLLDTEDLIKMSKKFDSTPGVQAMLAVTEYETPPEWSLSISKEGNLISSQPSALNIRSQDLALKYRDAGCMAIFTIEMFELYSDGLPDGTFKPFVLSRTKAVDLDNLEDLKFIEALMANKIVAPTRYHPK